jgi:hypothetical protein
MIKNTDNVEKENVKEENNVDGKKKVEKIDEKKEKKDVHHRVHIL